MAQQAQGPEASGRGQGADFDPYPPFAVSSKGVVRSSLPARAERLLSRSGWRTRP